ncbi:MAG: PorP/SprF family type IX secretion system membrane protein [Flavobacteriales bacterium]
MKLKNNIIAIFGFISIGALAQQTPSSVSFTTNEQYASPSNIGLYDYMQINASSRLLWLGVEDSPRTYFLGGNTAINDQHAVGAMFFSDKFGVTSQSGLQLDYALRTPIGLDYNMSFGIGPKLFQYAFNDADVTVNTPGDPVFGNSEESAFGFDMRAGISIYSDDLLISLSGDNLIETKLSLSGKDTRRNYLQRELKLYAHYHYQLEKANNFALEPSFLLKSKLYGHMQLYANLDVVYMDFVYVGGTFSPNDSYGFRLGLRAKELTLAYQFEVNSSDISAFSNTSHGIALSFRIFNEKSSQNNRWYERHKENAWIGKDSIMPNKKE